MKRARFDGDTAALHQIKSLGRIARGEEVLICAKPLYLCAVGQNPGLMLIQSGEKRMRGERLRERGIDNIHGLTVRWTNHEMQSVFAITSELTRVARSGVSPNCCTN